MIDQKYIDKFNRYYENNNNNNNNSNSNLRITNFTAKNKYSISENFAYSLCTIEDVIFKSKDIKESIGISIFNTNTDSFITSYYFYEIIRIWLINGGSTEQYKHLTTHENYMTIWLLS